VQSNTRIKGEENRRKGGNQGTENQFLRKSEGVIDLEDRNRLLNSKKDKVKLLGKQRSITTIPLVTKWGKWEVENKVKSNS